MAKATIPLDPTHARELRFPFCDGKLIDPLVETVNRVLAKYAKGGR